MMPHRATGRPATHIEAEGEEQRTRMLIPKRDGEPGFGKTIEPTGGCLTGHSTASVSPGQLPSGW